MSFRPLLVTEVDKRKISTYLQLNEIDKMFSYINEMLYQSYNNGLSQGAACADNHQNNLIHKLVLELEILRPMCSPPPLAVSGGR